MASKKCSQVELTTFMVFLEPDSRSMSSFIEWNQLGHSGIETLSLVLGKPKGILKKKKKKLNTEPELCYKKLLE